MMLLFFKAAKVGPSRCRPQDAKYSFPDSVLRFVRALLPQDVKGEFRREAYVVSLAEFAAAVL